MQKWEYHAGALSSSDYADHIRGLNNRGADGWELVNVLVVETLRGAEIIAYFKRPIAPPDKTRREALDGLNQSVADHFSDGRDRKDV